MRIKYIGGKASKEDNVAGTGLRWAQGQVHEVENVEACGKLLKHPDVWALDNEAETHAAIAARLELEEAERRAAEQRQREEAEAREKAELDARQKAEAEAADRAAAEKAAAEQAERDAKAQAEEEERARQAASVTGLSAAKAPGAMDLDELKSFCTAKGVKFHPNISKDKLLERLQAHAEGSQS